MPRNTFFRRFNQLYPNPAGLVHSINYPIPMFETLLPRQHAHRFANIENRVYANTVPIRANVAIHEPTLDELDIKYDIVPVLQRSGLWNLPIFEEKNVHPLSIELLASFRPEYDAHGDCNAWNYRISGILFRQDKRALCMLFGFLMDGAIPIYSDRERRRFYRSITGMDYFTPNSSPARIEDHAWRFIHLFISTNIYPRIDNGTTLTEKDLDLMIAINKREQVDYFQILTTEMELMRDNNYHDQVIGAGAFASALAVHHGFSLDGLEGVTPVFDIPFLIHKAILYPNSVDWIVIPEGEEYDPFPGDGKMEEEEGEEEDPEEDPNWEDNNHAWGINQANPTWAINHADLAWGNQGQVNQGWEYNNNIQAGWGNNQPAHVWGGNVPPVPIIGENDYIPAPPNLRRTNLCQLNL